MGERRREYQGQRPHVAFYLTPMFCHRARPRSVTVPSASISGYPFRFCPSFLDRVAPMIPGFGNDKVRYNVYGVSFWAIEPHSGFPFRLCRCLSLGLAEREREREREEKMQTDREFVGCRSGFF